MCPFDKKGTLDLSVDKPCEKVMMGFQGASIHCDAGEDPGNFGGSEIDLPAD